MNVFTVLALIVLALIGWVTIHLQRRTYFLEYIFFTRFPLFMGALVLLLFIPMTVGPTRNMLGNLGDLDVGPAGSEALYLWLGLAVTSLLATHLAWAVHFNVARTLELIPYRSKLPLNRPGAQRTRLVRLLNGWYRISGGPYDEAFAYRASTASRDAFIGAVLYSALSWPLIVLIIVRSGHSGLDYVGNALFALLGMALAWAGRGLSRYGQGDMFSLDVLQRVARRLLDFMGVEPVQVEAASLAKPDFEELKKQMLDREKLAVRTAEAGAFVGISILIYVALYVLTAPQYGVPVIPALGLILLFLLLLCFLFSFLAAYLDVLRIPVFLTFIVILYGSYELFGIDYFYEIRSKPEAVTVVAVTPEQVAARWRQFSPQDTVLTVVTASGGGIKTARWTAEVLTRLNEASDGAFGASVLFISSVSGGSVGAMYYVDRYRGPQTDHDRIRFESSHSSLYGTAWGIVYGDFWRWLPLLNRQDRGGALEGVWQKRLSRQETSLWSWWTDSTTWRPLQIYNATIAETGARILISAVDSVGGARTFARLYPNMDLSVATAARLSATFPYVSPIARPRSAPGYPDSVAFHLADGGYFDNHGVATAIDFLDRILTTDSTTRHVLFVQISATPKEAGDADLGNGWKYATLGPVTTLFEMRTAAQVDRNASQLKLFKDKWADRRIAIVPVSFLVNTGSLSWHLSKKEIAAFPQVWYEDTDNQEGCRVVLGRLGTPGDAAQRCERGRPLETAE